MERIEQRIPMVTTILTYNVTTSIEFKHYIQFELHHTKQIKITNAYTYVDINFN